MSLSSTSRSPKRSSFSTKKDSITPDAGPRLPSRCLLPTIMVAGLANVNSMVRVTSSYRGARPRQPYTNPLNRPGGMKRWSSGCSPSGHSNVQE